MLGRKNFTQEEIDHSRAEVIQLLAAHEKLVKAGAGADKKTSSAQEAFDALFFNSMVLVLDRPFVHRVRMVAGKDGNPVNEVEMLCDSLMNNNGILRDSTVIKLIPDRSVLKIRVGDRIRLNAEEFERLSMAFYAELEAKFL